MKAPDSSAAQLSDGVLCSAEALQSLKSLFNLVANHWAEGNNYARGLSARALAKGQLDRGPLSVQRTKLVPSQVRGTATEELPSSLLLLLRNTAWIPGQSPNVQGDGERLYRPRDVFLRTERIMSLLEDHAPYVSADIVPTLGGHAVLDASRMDASRMLPTLGAHADVDARILIMFLRRWAKCDTAELGGSTHTTPPAIRAKFVTSVSHMVS